MHSGVHVKYYKNVKKINNGKKKSTGKFTEWGSTDWESEHNLVCTVGRADEQVLTLRWWDDRADRWLLWWSFLVLTANHIVVWLLLSSEGLARPSCGALLQNKPVNKQQGRTSNVQYPGVQYNSCSNDEFPEQEIVIITLSHGLLHGPWWPENNLMDIDSSILVRLDNDIFLSLIKGENNVCWSRPLTLTSA